MVSAVFVNIASQFFALFLHFGEFLQPNSPDFVHHHGSQGIEGSELPLRLSGRVGISTSLAAIQGVVLPLRLLLSPSPKLG